MAEKPYKFYDRRGTNNGGSNRMIAAATPNYDRLQPPNLQYDTHRKITTWGLAKLRDISESLFWKYPIVQGALLEQVDLSVGTFIPQFYGENTKWGDKMEEKLYDYDDMFDVRGWPHDEESYRRNLLLYTRIHGSHWTLLTESSNGFPMVQVIPAHRIGGAVDTAVVQVNDDFSPPSITGEDGKPTQYKGTANPWTGLHVVAGAIVNENGTTMAYRLYSENKIEFKDYSAQSLFPSFFTVAPDQLIGIPTIAVCAFDFQDIGETRDFEKLAQKAAARITLIETNEGGEPPPGADLIAPGASGGASPSDSSLYSEKLEGGLYTYLKAGTGSSIATLVANRPTESQQSYEDRLLRGAFYGMEWSYEFTLHNIQVGGAPYRGIVERINRTCRKNQQMVAKTMRRVHGHRISKFIKLGILEPDKDWYKVQYQGPGVVSADRKYESEIDLKENERGFLSTKDAIEKRGGAYRQTFKRKVEETSDKAQAAKELAASFGITIQEAYDWLWKPNPNAPAPVQQPEKPSAAGDE